MFMFVGIRFWLAVFWVFVAVFILIIAVRVHHRASLGTLGMAAVRGSGPPCTEEVEGPSRRNHEARTVYEMQTASLPAR